MKVHSYHRFGELEIIVLRHMTNAVQQRILGGSLKF